MATNELIEAEMPEDWFNLYNWDKLKNKSYADRIAHLIEEKFDSIKLSTADLRKVNFRQGTHKGQALVSKNRPSDFTEKRFCRAFFNKHKSDNNLYLGITLDYEVPLGGVQNAEHGDIDLISRTKNKLFVIEAKQYNSRESILKALLESYVYSQLLKKVEKSFRNDFGLDNSTVITPVVLTFATATSGQQLLSRGSYPYMDALLKKMNKALQENGINEIEFFLIENTASEIKECLDFPKNDDNSVQVVFKKGFYLKIKKILI